jgi:hypothetical protein
MRRERKYHYIYKTACKVTGKFYVGMHSTDNLEDGYMGSGKRLWYSIRKHGKENHEREILEFLPNRSSLKSREKEIVNEKFLEDPLCMNLQIGGGGGFFSEEHQRKAAAAGGKVHSDKMKFDFDYRNKVLKTLRDNRKKSHAEGKIKYDTFTGKKHTEEAKRLIGKKNSVLQKGNKNSQYGTCWITNGTENKKIKKDTELPSGWKYGRK